MYRVAIHSVPRSGSTWLGQIFNSTPSVKYAYQPLFSYAFKSRLNENSTKDEIHLFFNDLLHSHDDFILQKELLDQYSNLEFEKNNITHIIYKEVRYHYILKNLLEQDEELRLVALVRNPLATVHSWWKAPREFRKDLHWNIDEEWEYADKKNMHRKEEYNGYRKWKETAILFENLQRTYPNRVYLLNFGTLLKATEATIKELFDFCRIPFTRQTIAFINASKSMNDNDPYSVFKKKIDDLAWQQSLPMEIIVKIQDDLKGTSLIKYLL